MSLSNSDLTHLLLAVVLLLLGPTVLGLVAPEWQQAIFQDGRVTQAGLGIFYQLGLLLLMYCSGAELRSILSRRDGRATAGIAALGNAVPFLAGLGFLKLYDTDRFLGPAGNRTAFVLVFALAMAVTSIPVISRIMADLGILGTRFARIVLSVAVLEDLAVYIVLNVAIGHAAAGGADGFSLPALVGIQPASAAGSGYYTVATLAFFALPAMLGTGAVQRLAELRGNLLERASPIAFQLVFMLALAGLAAFLGVAPLFGALMAGILAGDLRGAALEARTTITGFSYAVIIPLY